MKTKVKLFFRHDIECLEEDINEFIKDRAIKKIVIDSNGSGFLALIIYSEYDKKYCANCKYCAYSADHPKCEACSNYSNWEGIYANNK